MNLPDCGVKVHTEVKRSAVNDVHEVSQRISDASQVVGADRVS